MSLFPFGLLVLAAFAAGVYFAPPLQDHLHALLATAPVAPVADPSTDGLRSHLRR